jgi:hypothetical protein
VKAEEARFVWLFVFFDLPTVTKPEKRAAAKFRQFLKDDGFLMLQCVQGGEKVGHWSGGMMLLRAV